MLLQLPPLLLQWLHVLGTAAIANGGPSRNPPFSSSRLIGRACVVACESMMSTLAAALFRAGRKGAPRALLTRQRRGHRLLRAAEWQARRPGCGAGKAGVRCRQVGKWLLGLLLRTSGLFRGSVVRRPQLNEGAAMGRGRQEFKCPAVILGLNAQLQHVSSSAAAVLPRLSTL